MYPSLREESLDALLQIGFDLVMRLVVCLSASQRRNDALVLDNLVAQMPADRPRYLMGVGTPSDLVEAVSLGIDMFDCVMPTRNARNAHIFTSEGVLKLRNAQFKMI